MKKRKCRKKKLLKYLYYFVAIRNQYLIHIIDNILHT